MTAEEFRNELAALGFTPCGFASFAGANERTVRRWATNEQDIPAWVGVMLRLMRQLADFR